VEEGGGGNETTGETLRGDAGTKTGGQVNGSQLGVAIERDAEVGMGKDGEKEEEDDEAEVVY
jgi:hypothetical protein